MTEIAAFDGLLIVHAEDRAIDRRARAGRTAALPATSSTPGRAVTENLAIADGDRRAPAGPAAGCTSCTSPPPSRCR